MSKIQELREELDLVFSGRGIKIADSSLPLIVFLLSNWLLDINSALILTLVVSAFFLVYRLVKGEKLIYALVGLGGAGIAAGVATLSGTGSGYFLPGMISGLITVLLSLGSVLVKKPLAAWTSMLTRRWPLEWYWHDQIRPAYSEVTLIWALAFGLRSGLEFWLLRQEAINSLGVVRILMGWPYTIAVLVLSYIYGVWRLGNLAGPSVDEYNRGVDPPWESQKKGF